MNRPSPPIAVDRQGYALMTVTIFAFILVIAGLAFFAMSSYETNQAMYRQESSEAFYLADGAIERARAQLLLDRTWRAGYPATDAGNGSYSLVVRDTTIGGVPHYAWMQATGTVGNARRRIELLAAVPATAPNLLLVILGEATIRGDLEVEGHVHINDPTLSDNDQRHVDGDLSWGFPVYPPVMHTEAAYFPGSSYYDVQGEPWPGHPGQYMAVAYDAFTGAAAGTLYADNGVDVEWNPGQHTLTVDFQNVLDEHFYGAPGIPPSFPLQVGTQHVVVNFSGPHYALDPNSITDLTLNDDGVPSLLATVINARYIGPTNWAPNPDLPATDPANINPRLLDENWLGGMTEVKQVTLEPSLGIGLIAHDFQWVGGANVVAGTDENPCLIYVTGDVTDINSNFMLTGSIVTLGDWNSQGGPTLVYDPDFIERMPDPLSEEWDEGVSGTMEILSWQEVAAN